MIALIEDEKEKAEALKDALVSFGIEAQEIIVINNVRDAVLAVSSNDYDAIILDVSLPTFSPEDMAGSAGRAQQQSGGIEVIRALQDESKSSNLVIVTQYHDVMFHNDSVPLDNVPDFVWAKYKQKVKAAILYRESQSGYWISKLRSALGIEK